MTKSNVNETSTIPPTYNYDIAVVGAGPAGLAAALKANDLGCSVILLDRDIELGGILQQCIHNGFGLKYFKEELTGPEYAQRFIDRLESTNVKIMLRSMVISMSPNLTLTAINSSEGLFKIQAKAIILAMGCRERTRGAINIPGTRPAGIFPAGQAQRLMNIEGYLPGHRVVILGSGDIGMIMARRCMLEGLKVLAVAEVLPYPSGLVRNQVQCLIDYNIPLFLRHTIIDIRGKQRVEGVTIAQVDEKWRPMPGTEKTYDCDTILFSVGLIPENELSVGAGIELASNGGPKVNEYLQTNVPGIFACGNVLQVHDLVDWVTTEAERAGENAALYVQKRLETCAIDEEHVVEIIAGENVLYVKPDRIDCLTEDKVLHLSFRVKNPKSNIRSILISKDKMIFNKRHKFVVPSEMILLDVKLIQREIGRQITVNVQEKELATNIIEKEMMQDE